MPRGKHPIVKGAKSHFSDYVDRHLDLLKDKLPITHVTDAYDLRDIVDTNVLAPHYCSVFDKELTYLFYGRPAYRKNGDVQATSLAAYAPIVLIMKPDLIEKAAAIFPFDSGAFTEKYGQFTHHRMKVQDFGLEPSSKSVGKLVSCFYGGNQAYYDQIAKCDTKIPSGEFEAQTFLEIISFKGKNDKDDRSSTIEVILDKALDIKGILLGMVIPHSLLLDQSFKKKLKSFGLPLITYGDGASLTPASQIPRLQDIVRNFYRRKRFLR